MYTCIKSVNLRFEILNSISDVVNRPEGVRALFLFFLGETSTIGSRFFVGFVFPGAPEGSTGRELFVEKPGIEPATPGLQGE